MKKNLLKTLAFVSLACTIAFTTITPTFATEAENNEVLEEKEETIETTELEPSAQSLDVDEDNELEEVVKTWVAKNPEYEKEVEITSPAYHAYYTGRRERCIDAVDKIFIAKNNGRYVAYSTGAEAKKNTPYWEVDDKETILYFIIPHNGYYVHDFDEEGYHFYEDGLPWSINSEYEKP